MAAVKLLMLHSLISPKVESWFAEEGCPARPIIEYIEKRGGLRHAQVEAIKTYLFLKIAGGNRPLWQLFCGGAITESSDLTQLPISQTSREVLESNAAARALFDFSRTKNNGAKKGLFPELETYLQDNVGSLDCQSIAKRFFYNVDYSDYLFSLPMGAGKTYLMAAFIYLDLYFALNEPDNKTFAHNFIILVPSGLKSSIIPSLKTIEKFDATWVLPEPAASEVKRLIQFEVLDQPKSAKKSNKARNPNAQKVSRHQPFDDLMGLVLVTNAEKVILDRVALDDQGRLFEQSDDEKDKAANELRNLIGKIPNLQIHIDEVHHAATDEVKLRQVVNKWNQGGTINGVLGFSGTPYLSSVDKVDISPTVSVKFGQITNTVYYYPLTRAIQDFLKKPTVKPMSGLEPLTIVRHGVEDFYAKFGDKVYANGTVAKLAIYCGNIDRLEEEIFPFLTGEMKIPAEAILKYHRGNKKHSITREAQIEFESLDTSLSKKRIILLVQIGKEGWDCKSLTGVVLSQKGDCPSNMVLQTSCRCLRQADPGVGVMEEAGVWLNADNAQILDKQLKEEQNTSIAEINNLSQKGEAETRERVGRLDYLKLPPVQFYQLEVRYDTLTVEDALTPESKIKAIDATQWRHDAMIVERGLALNDVRQQSMVQNERGEIADFRRWLFDISKGSFNVVSLKDLNSHEAALRSIFEKITFEDKGERRFNVLYDQVQIASLVRLAFHRKRDLQTHSDIVPRNAKLLLVEKLAPIDKTKTLYPSEEDTAKILEIDTTGKTAEEYELTHQEEYAKAQEALKALGLNVGLLASQSQQLTTAVRHKDRAFHFLPYDFTKSNFELKFLQQALLLSDVKDRDLELYFNGENHLTEFRIMCHERKGNTWRPVGLYTPDFLVIQRREGQIHRVLIIETKGSGFGDQKAFKARRKFMEDEFLHLNNEKFGYGRFEYLYLSDSDNMTTNLGKLSTTISGFFTD